MGRSRSSSSSGGSSGGRSSGFFSRPAAKPAAAPQPQRQQHSQAAPTQTATRPQSAAPPAPINNSAPMQQQSAPSGGGMMSGLGGMIMQGMAFGGGSAIAHRAVDGIMGPRTVVHEHKEGEVTPMASSSSSSMTGFRACEDESLSFQQCLKDNTGDVSKCNWYYDALTTCQKSSRS